MSNHGRYSPTARDHHWRPGRTRLRTTLEEMVRRVSAQMTSLQEQKRLLEGLGAVFPRDLSQRGRTPQWTAVDTVPPLFDPRPRAACERWQQPATGPVRHKTSAGGTATARSRAVPHQRHRTTAARPNSAPHHQQQQQQQQHRRVLGSRVRPVDRLPAGQPSATACMSPTRRPYAARPRAADPPVNQPRSSLKALHATRPAGTTTSVAAGTGRPGASAAPSDRPSAASPQSLEDVFTALTALHRD